MGKKFVKIKRGEVDTSGYPLPGGLITTKEVTDKLDEKYATIASEEHLEKKIMDVSLEVLNRLDAIDERVKKLEAKAGGKI